MNYSDIIAEEKAGLRRDANKIDTLFRLKKKSTFKKLYDDIDRGLVKESDLFRRVYAMLEMTLLSSRQKNRELFVLLQDTSFTNSILVSARRYLALYAKIFVIDRDDIEYFDALLDNEYVNITEELNNFFGDDTENALFACNIICDNNIYYVSIPNLKCESKYKDELKTIKLYSSSDQGKKGFEPVYTAHIDLDNSTDRIEIADKKIKVACNCAECKYFQESDIKHEDESRTTKCSWLNTNYCKGFNTRLRPEELFQAALSIIYALNHREEINNILNLGAKSETEMRDCFTTEDSYLYIKTLYNEIKKVVKLDEELKTDDKADTDKEELETDKLKETAPRREHERKGHYVHYKNGKVVYRRGCTVNKGKEKTTYKVKVSKDAKQELCDK